MKHWAYLQSCLFLLLSCGESDKPINNEPEMD